MLSFEPVVPKHQNIEALTSRAVLMPFADEVIGFIVDLSRTILTSPEFREYPEMMAFAYWMREARLKKLHLKFKEKSTGGILVARGVVFHIAPSNVDTIFLYSLLLSMLVGNKNIVRISSRDSDQVSAIINLFNRLLEKKEHAIIAEHLAIVRYGHDDAVTSEFSELCDMRVIWGGDTTINAIRSIPISPRANEICFADKVSLSVFDAIFYNELEDKLAFVKKFINDAFWFGQMACSSPRLVVWRGDELIANKASSQFWKLVESELKLKPPELSDMDYLNKLVFEQNVALKGKSHIRNGRNNYLNVIRLKHISDLSMEQHCGGGLFLEVNIHCLTELASVLSKHYQTVVSCGIKKNEWLKLITEENPSGIDRVVNVGTALDFSPIWDGFDLLREFSREITVLDE